MSATSRCLHFLAVCTSKVFEVNDGTWYVIFCLFPDYLLLRLSRCRTVAAAEQEYADFGSGVYAPITRLGRRIDQDSER